MKSLHLHAGLLCVLVHAAAAMSRQQALKELDLRAGYDGGDLKRAYRARAIATHPDKGGSPEAFLRALRRAEEMLGKVLDDLFAAEDPLTELVERLIGPVGMNPAKWLLKRALKGLAAAAKPLLQRAMENAEGATITVNGKPMSGKEASQAFAEWREALRGSAGTGRSEAQAAASEGKRRPKREL
ncbi:hypothetical protein EMIHUDRAFT_238226 [Emiliania huxleyi CCMP1516]|uniref:J domain-containing protein n=2 Tax=Emiliania huxleyi TaxID=2903 RepID=A0A0D3JMU3_EMIH1|nr:hypothetical protein EMIHUDRAFT_238226 [Emiliania huxleyi CCMP1516]EOD24828.1 hypothetical protein EMIHUDRAFT_238226 [Emiliania huxleyi CCMP1516]|eukprot:XP_005777257.1 hypothetical protein EMIHUDRAFT_238226 [Emiliania huxleyi CCMP1516]